MLRAKIAAPIHPIFLMQVPQPTIQMTTQEAEAKGYKLVDASPFEVGLVFNGQGIRTWWAKDLWSKDYDEPTLEHPKVQEAIRITEDMLHEARLKGP